MRTGLFCLLILFLQGCGSPYLERSAVPMMWGIQIQEEGNDPIEDNFAELANWEPKDLLVDIPLQVDSSSNFLPSISPEVLESLEGYHQKCRDLDIRLHVGLSFPASRDMFPRGRVPDPVAWFESFYGVADTVLQSCQQPLPERLVLGEGVILIESFIPQWTRMLDSLRAHYDCRFSYASSIERVDRIHFWENCDEISLSYPPLSDESAKTWCRAYNRLASEVAKGSQKPIFIYRSNLIGEQKDFLLKNRLRFWEDSVQIDGLAINTLYSQPAFLDSTTYYGLMGKKEVLQFIREYPQR